MSNKASSYQRIFAFLLMVTIHGTLFAQYVTVKGRVTDSFGEPMMAVNIAQLGTPNGGFTGPDGEYELTLPSNSTLAFSFIGYKMQSIPVNGRTVIDVVMTEDAILLNETVIIGYGVQKKSEVTNSVASIDPNLFNNLATTDAAAAIQGKVAGVQVLNSTGAPGQSAAIRVRGYSSNSADIGPLYIVDGLLVKDISYLDPSLIASMDVLKDAASAAIYGAQAGNGVILITTKNGKSNEGKSTISYDMKLTRQTLGRKPKILDAPNLINYIKMKGFDADSKLLDENYDGTDTDWVSEVFVPSWAFQHSLSLQGGNDKSHYFTNLNYVNNDGIVKGDKDIYKRLAIQINADYNITKWLTVGTNTSIEKWKSRQVTDMASEKSLLNSCLTIDPMTPVHYSDPSQFSTSVLQNYNNPDGLPVMKDSENGLWYATSHYDEDDNGNPFIQRDRIDETFEGIDVMGTMFANLSPYEGLIITSRLGYKISQGNIHSWSVPYFASTLAQVSTYSIGSQANNSFYYQWENFANYSKSIKDHSMTGMVGMSYIEDRRDWLEVNATAGDLMKKYASNYRYLDYVKDGDNKSVGNAPTLSTQISYFGRLTYSYNDLYDVQANLRADAFDSSVISKENRWGFFPSFSAGWTLSHEGFFQEIVEKDVLNYLKIRASWGLNGNVKALSNYRYANSVLANSNYYQFNKANANDLTYASAPDKLANDNLTWETSDQIDLGLDARLFSNRLYITVDWYRKLTKDLLVEVPPLPETGHTSTMYNAGRVLNRGVEFEATWYGKRGDFNYSAGLNFATLKNKVLSLHSDIDRIETLSGGVLGTNNRIRNAFEAGYPIWYFRGYKYNGVNPETGAPIYEDTEGVERSALDEADMQYIGSAIPKVTYGLNINMSYKDFDFSLVGAGVAGNKIFNVLQRADRPWRNSLSYFYDHAWTPENKSASMPDPAQCNDYTFFSSSAAMFDGSYFKLKQIQFGYTLPAELTKKAGINNMRVYVSFDDFITFTSYPGLDPETATNTDNGFMGFDGGTYPTMRKLLCGVNLTF